MMYGWRYNHASFGIWGVILMVIVMALLLAGVIIVIHYLTAHSSGKYYADGDSALAILEKRYVTGEIEKTEFEEKRKTLSQ